MFVSVVLALLFRSLRVDARSLSPHLIRLGLMIAIYVTVTFVQSTAGAFGSPGFRFFQSMIWLNLVFISLAGIGSFSCVITEEKEEDTLGLLRMAGVDPLGLLLGKSGGPVIQTLLLILVQYPFTLLSITLGGVNSVQVQAGYLSLIGYVLFLAGLGALCSTVCKTSRSASRLTVVMLVLYWLVPWGAMQASRWPPLSGTLIQWILQFVSETCIFVQMEQILMTARTESPVSVQAWSNALMGTCCLLAAWLLFGVFSSSSRIDPQPRGLVATRQGAFRWFHPGRPRIDPLVWKDFHFSSSGLAGILIRSTAYVSLFIVILVESGNWLDSVNIFLGCMVFAIPFDASLLVSRALMEERRGQTIPSLVMLPRSVPSIVYAKLGGALLGLLPGLTFFAAAFFASNIIRQGLFSGPGFSMVFFYVIPNCVLLPHLSAVFALRVQRGAVPLALGAMYALQFVENMFLAIVMFALLRLTGVGFEAIFFVTAILNLGLCAWCHRDVIRRFRKLSEV